jgi:hypothetical protein
VQPVPQGGGRATGEPLDHEPGTLAQLGGQLLGEHPQPAGAAVGVGDLQQDLGVGPARHPGRGHGPPGGEPEALPGHSDGRQQGQGQHEQSQLHEGELAQQCPQCSQGQPGGDQAAAAQGQ